jgi:hypothetical protein
VIGGSFNAKGGGMIHREVSSKVSSVAVGMLIIGLTLCVGAGSAMASSGSLLGFPLTVSPMDVQTPQVRGELREENVFSSRATLEAELETFGSTATWHAEYATSENGPWTPAGEGTVVSYNGESVSIGAADETSGESVGAEHRVLHHLQPSTSYYARFVVENAGGTASRIFAFTTLPVGKPEVPPGALGGSTFRLTGSTSTTATFISQIETNGAATEYHYEYTTEPENSASWKPFTSGASGTVTVAEDFANPAAELTGLEPETTYYIRLKASNEKGAIELDTYEGNVSNPHPRSFTTTTLRPIVVQPEFRDVTGASVRFDASVNPHGSQTTWRYEDTTTPEDPSSWKPIVGEEGTISQAQAESLPEGYGGAIQGSLAGLHASSKYCVRAFASNHAGEGRNGYGEFIAGETQGYECFETAGPPNVTTAPVHAMAGESLRLLGRVRTDSAPTSTEQTITLGGTPTGGIFALTFNGQTTGATFTGSTTAGSKDVTGTAVSSGALVHGEIVSGPGIPAGATLVEDNGPRGDEVLTLSEAATESNAVEQLEAGIAYDADANSLQEALDELPGKPEVSVQGFPGGPYTVVFVNGDAGLAEPQITADGSGLIPSQAVTVSTIEQGAPGYNASAYFEYVTQQQYEQSGFNEAAKTTEAPVAPDGRTFVGQGMSGIQAGQAYDYRLVVASAFPEHPLVLGAVQQLTAPAPAPTQQPACPNAQSRTGASANLPDCRAYEQVTPVDKEGAQEAYNYGPKVDSGALVGEDGEHLLFENPVVNWGSGTGSGASPYLFSRHDAQHGWSITSGAPQPETGAQQLVPELYNDDLTQVAVEAGVHTSLGDGLSMEVNYEVGPTGGPYSFVASVPRKDVETGAAGFYDGWVAASDDFSKLILQVEDHKLLEGPTGTKSGNDLYEYSSGELSQVNVGVGSCGAHIVDGREQKGVHSSANAVSADGSRVFFEAVPGSNCSAATHLYMRKDGAETVDIGAYRFAGASPQGTEVLLASASGGETHYATYDTETGSTKQIFSGPESEEVGVSDEFKAIYFRSEGGEVYRYDTTSETLAFAFWLTPNTTGTGIATEISPDGRYYYFQGGVPGVPGENQAFLYDSTEHVVECLSCASSFDPEPKLGSFFSTSEESGVLGPLQEQNAHPGITSLSSNGDFAFFDTTAALLPSDVDGEVAPEATTGVEHQSDEDSVSSDVYEWRRDGIDGCGQLQGCLALITNGRGGVLNLLIGATPDGSNVFFYTLSQLLPQDNDNAGDIYDARLDGGLSPPPPAPTECEASACSTPANAPNDATPSSSTYVGAGNTPALVVPSGAGKAKKVESKKKHGKARKRSKKGSRKSSLGRGKAKKSSGGSKS